MNKILTSVDVHRLGLDKKQHISAADLQDYDEIGGEVFAHTRIVSIEIPENITTIGSKCVQLLRGDEKGIPQSVFGRQNMSFRKCRYEGVRW